VVFFDNHFPEEIANYNGKWGRFDETAHSPPSTNKAKYLRDDSTLQELLQDLPLHYNHPGVIEEQLMHGFAAARKAPKVNDLKQPPIWFCFAVQIYLDILYSTEVCMHVSDASCNY
jgi:hypothetical protein